MFPAEQGQISVARTSRGLERTGESLEAGVDRGPTSAGKYAVS
jgi:hypothetical protein